METDSPTITKSKKRRTESSDEETKVKKNRDGKQRLSSQNTALQVQGTEESPDLSPVPCTSDSTAVADGTDSLCNSSAATKGIAIKVRGQNSGEIVGFKQVVNHHLENKVVNVVQGNDNFKSLVERTRASMNASCPQGFVETAGYRQARDLLLEQSKSVITGQAGSGKTTLAYRLMTHFCSQGFHCVELLSPDEYAQVPWQQSHDFKLVLFIDDVVGRSSLEVALKKKWEKKLEKMMPFVSSGHVKLILTSREHIFAAFREGSKREVLSGTPEVALACNSLVLSFLERKQILINAMKFKRVALPGKLTENAVVQAAVDSQQIGYPQLCWFFVTTAEAQGDPMRFFANPVEFLKKEFASLKVDDKKSFYVLLLVLLQEGKLTQNFLRSQKSAKFIAEVADFVGLSRVPKFGEIKRTATEMCRSYLRYDNDTKAFLFAHQSVWDTLFVYLCEEDFEKALKICSCKQVVLYITTEGCRESRQGLTYRVPRVEWKVLARKLLQEIVSGATDLACSHPCLQDLAFVQVFLHEFLQEEDKRALLTPRAEGQTLRSPTYKISAKDYTHCSLKCGDFLTFATSVGCKGQAQGRSLLQYSHPVSFLALHRCFTIVQHILDSESFSELAPEAKSRLLTEVLACSCFVAKTSFVGSLLDRGATPSAECIMLACSAGVEDAELVERLLQWRHLLTTEQQCELARVAVLKDRPRTLQLVLSGLSVPDDGQALLDSILAELVLLTHGADLISHNQSLKLSNFSPLLLLLTKAGAQLHPYISMCLAAGHWESSVFKTLLDSLAATSGKDVTPVSSTEDDASVAQTNDASFSSKAENLSCGSAAKVLPTVLSAQDDGGSSPLHWAARFGVLANVQFLLKLSEEGGQLAKFVNAQNKKGYSALHLAAEFGHLDLVAALLAAKADAGLLNKHQDSALHLATQKGHVAVVEALVQGSANVNSANNKKNTALHVAAKTGQLHIIGTLLEKGADANLVNQQGHTALQIIASKSRLNVADGKMSEEGAVEDKGDVMSHEKIFRSLIATTSKRPHETSPPLLGAARQGKLPMVKMLLDGGSDVNTKNPKGLTALHEAARHCHLQVAELLLQRGAKTCLTDEGGNTVLHALAGSNLQSKIDAGAVEVAQVVDFVKKWAAFVGAVNNAGNTPVMTALSKGNLLLATEMLASCKPDMGLRNKHGDSFLHALAGAASLRSGHGKDRSVQQMVAVLVGQFSSFLDEVNEAGDTPLLTALHAGNFRVVKELLHHHCNPNVTNKKGWSTLHALAAGPVLQGKKEIQQIIHQLVDKCSGFVNSKDETSDTPILIAAGKGNIALMNCLLTHEADLSVLNKKRNSVLHALASAGDLTNGLGITSFTQEFVSSLIQKVREDFIDMPDDDGNTPIMLALRSANTLLVQELLRRECDLSLVNRDGETVLHLLAQVAQVPAGRMVAEWREAVDAVLELAEEVGVLPTAADNNGITPRTIASRLAEVGRERYSGYHLVSLWGKEAKPVVGHHLHGLFLTLEWQDHPDSDDGYGDTDIESPTPEYEDLDEEPSESDSRDHGSEEPPTFEYEEIMKTVARLLHSSHKYEDVDEEPSESDSRDHGSEEPPTFEYEDVDEEPSESDSTDHGSEEPPTPEYEDVDEEPSESDSRDHGSEEPPTPEHDDVVEEPSESDSRDHGSEEPPTPEHDDVVEEPSESDSRDHGSEEPPTPEYEDLDEEPSESDSRDHGSEEPPTSEYEDLDEEPSESDSRDHGSEEPPTSEYEDMDEEPSESDSTDHGSEESPTSEYEDVDEEPSESDSQRSWF